MGRGRRGAQTSWDERAEGKREGGREEWWSEGNRCRGGRAHFWVTNEASTRRVFLPVFLKIFLFRSCRGQHYLREYLNSFSEIYFVKKKDRQGVCSLNQSNTRLKPRGPLLLLPQLLPLLSAAQLLLLPIHAPFATPRSRCIRPWARSSGFSSDREESRDRYS